MFDIKTGTAIAVAVACVGSVALLTGAGRRQGPPTQAPTVPDAYAFLYPGSRTKAADFEAARRALPYTSISIDHKGCFGVCPIYSATLSLNGAATYNGERYVERVGRFSGRVDLRDFGQLVLQVERSGFMSLADQFSSPEADHETITVTVTRRVNGVKSLTDYGSYAPPEVWLLERAIAGVVSRIRWTAVGRGQ
jgi:hypothetical protein